MDFTILAIGDIVGRPGKQIVLKRLPAFRQERRIDFVVANAENIAGGSGITPSIADELLKGGVDLLTSGDHVYKKKEYLPYLQGNARALRPDNYPTEAAGTGFSVVDTARGCRVAVLNLQGRVFMQSVECPFKTALDRLSTLDPAVKIVIVDIHAEATSEKIALGWLLDGKVSLIFGTHTHVQTSDERILPGGTAYISDVGMTGPHTSVLGRRIDAVLRKFITNMPTPFDVAEGDCRLHGVLATVDLDTGRALSVERVALLEDGPPASRVDLDLRFLKR